MAVGQPFIGCHKQMRWSQTNGARQHRHIYSISGDSDNFSGQWSATSGATPEPNASVATLTHSTRTWTTGLNTLNAPADTQLDANTTYFLILSYSGRRAFLNISATDETSADGGGAAGWSVGQRFDGVADSWSSAALRLKFRVNGRR